MNRAYSVLTVKSLDGDARIVRGIATTPSVDRLGDVIEPKGIEFTNPMPFLWQHQHDAPIGTVKFSAPTDKGIEFEAEIASISEPGRLKDRVDEAWQSIKAGLVRAVSIGFMPKEYEPLPSGGIRFIKSVAHELSAVTIPANADAVITTIKSIDAAARKAAGIVEPESLPVVRLAASGTEGVVRLDAPARDGANPPVIRSIKRLP